MNYLPFCGYGFFGASTDGARAAFFSSWGLLDSAPSYVPTVVYRSVRWLTSYIARRVKR